MRKKKVRKKRVSRKQRRKQKEPDAVLRRGDTVALRSDLTCIGVIASTPKRNSSAVEIQWPNKGRLYLHATQGLEKIV